MDHTLAQQTNTLDRYLLDEMTPDERFEFEEHMFDCPACAATVKNDFAAIDDLRAILGEPRAAKAKAATESGSGWRTWFRTWNFAPALAAAALVCVVGYQNLVSIPAMRAPRLLDTVTVVSTTRGTSGAGDAVAVDSKAAVFAANFDVVARAGESYVCQFRAEDQTLIANLDCGKHATNEFTLTVLLPTAKFKPGRYTMNLSSASDAKFPGTNYAFSVKNESN